MPRLIPLLVFGSLGAGVVACAKPSDDRAAPPLTQRQKDSVVGASALPGARGVQGALSAADSQKVRNAAMDSLAKAP